jgi:hypothetical protein
MRRALRPAAILLGAVLMLWASSAWAHEAEWPGKRLAVVFPKAKKFKSQQVTLTAEQVARIEKETGTRIEGENKAPKFYIAYGDSEKSESGKQPIGAVVFIDAVGQRGSMEINVVITPEGALHSVSLWESKESKQLQSKEFLKQFMGKKATDAFQVGKDVVPAAGALKASQAVSTSAKLGLSLFREVFVKKDADKTPADSIEQPKTLEDSLGTDKGGTKDVKDQEKPNGGEERH